MSFHPRRRTLRAPPPGPSCATLADAATSRQLTHGESRHRQDSRYDDVRGGAVGGGILISGGTVVDGTGAPARPGEAVLVRDGRITALGQQALDDAQAKGVDERIDATGRTVMPGLIDA